MSELGLDFSRIGDAGRELSENGAKGAWAELIACAWLIEQGYEVFRSVSPSSRADIVAVDKHGLVVLIDVKLSRRGSRHPLTLKPHQVKIGVVPLFVSGDGVCAFDLSMLRAVYKAAGAAPAKLAVARRLMTR